MRDAAGTRPRGRRSAAAALLLVVAVTACDEHDGDEGPADVVSAAVRVEATGCRARPSVGAGSFLGDELVLTVAHVVAGSDDVRITLSDGSSSTASVVAIDRDKDLAVLAVEAEASPLPVGRARPGDRGDFVVWRDEAPVTNPFEIITYVDINASNIDHDGSGLRKGFQIDAQVDNGDSGSVLVHRGEAVGVVFARSTGDGGRAWATDIREAVPLLDEAADRAAVDVGRCVG